VSFGVGQFTLQLPPWDPRDHAQLYADTIELAGTAEDAGFDSFWLAEHHGSEDGYMPSLLPFLAAVASRTTRLRIGTAVILAPFHHPLRLAEDASVVDNISAGRLLLGLGLGWVADEYRMFGVETKGRGRRLEEVVQILRKAWTGERFTHRGRFYSFDDVLVRPAPARVPPIFLGGRAEAALARAARLGDGHYPPSTQHGAQIIARARTVLEVRKGEGLDGPYRFGFFAPVGFGDDADAGWEAIRDGLLHLRGSYTIWEEGGRDTSVARHVAAEQEEKIRASAIVGSPRQVVEQLKPILGELRQMGFAEVFMSAILAPPGTPPEKARAAVETFAEKVIPALR
jgi:probable F420-dependent oxidoreductase